MGRGEQERASPLSQHLAQRGRAGDVSAQHAHRLAHRPDLDRHPSVEVEMIHRPAPVAPQHARSVGVVHHDGRTEFLGRGHDPGEWRDVAIHAEDAVRDHQDEPVRRPGRGPGT